MGFNITSLVTSLVGNNTLATGSSYPVFFRWTSPNTAVRLGVGTRGFTNDFFDNVTGSFRSSNQKEYRTKLGIEINRPFDNRWQFYFGVDALANLDRGSTEIVVEQFRNDIVQQTFGVGLSPFAGVRFFVGKRFYLSTEANLSYVYRFIKMEQTTNDINGNPEVNTSSNNTESFALSTPTSIYINYRLK